MTVNPSRAWDWRRHVSVALRVVWAVLAFGTMMPCEAGAQSVSEGKTQPPAAKGGNSETPKAAPQALEYETVKLDNGTEVSVEKWGKTYPACEYRPPIDILDRRVHVVLDAERDGAPAVSVTGLEVDSEGGRLYWSEGLNRPRPTGSIRRARLDGRGVQTLATNRVYPRNLVLDTRRGRIYWLEGIGNTPCTLQSATLDGRNEETLSRGLNQASGLALDSARGHLYYWERFRLVRVNTDGTGEKVVTDNRRIVQKANWSLAFDAVRDRLVFAARGRCGWLDKNATLLEFVARIEYWFTIYGFELDAEHQKIYFADGRALWRANPDCTRLETLVASPTLCADGFARSIAGDAALDLTRGQVYWTGIRSRGAAQYPTICRTDLRPLPEPTMRPAPPRIAVIEPYEQTAGGELILSGDGLAGAAEVSFIDDSTGAHVPARFRTAGDGRLAVTVPRLGGECRRPVIVVRTPSGVTMALGTDVLTPEHTGPAYIDIVSLTPDAGSNRFVLEPGAANRPYQHERSAAGPGARVWLRPGLIGGKIEAAVVYAMHGTSVTFGPKGMVTAFAKDDSYVAVHQFSKYDNTVVYHEPFAALSWTFHHDTTAKHIPVSAIRPSFPRTSFRYRVH